MSANHSELLFAGEGERQFRIQLHVDFSTLTKCNIRFKCRKGYKDEDYDYK